jgi:N-acetylglucosamine kinase-like BadF-type ATPase
MSSPSIVLAVDGGNSKTDLALLESSGRMLALVRGGGSSPHHLGVDGCIDVLQSLLDDARVRANLAHDAPFAAAQILVAGADLPEERTALRTALERQRWGEGLVVDNDMPALLRAGTDRGSGIAVVCGAGINCLGVAPDGREVRFPSLGEISGDWGGGADVGLAALAAAARSADGRGPNSALEGAVPAHFGLSEPSELARALHLGQIPRERLRELAPLVLAASAEDAVAASIVRRLAEEVVAFARAAIRRLQLTESDPDVILGGRLLRSLPPSVIDTIAEEVRRVAPDARVVVSASEPIVGAALRALDALAAGTTAGARARAELDAAAAAFSAASLVDLG